MGRVPTSLRAVLLICLALFHLVDQSRAAGAAASPRLLSELDEVRQTAGEEEFVGGGEGRRRRRRVAVQMNDYAPSGPNDRHTPKP